MKNVFDNLLFHYKRILTEIRPDISTFTEFCRGLGLTFSKVIVRTEMKVKITQPLPEQLRATYVLRRIQNLKLRVAKNRI